MNRILTQTRLVALIAGFFMICLLGCKKDSVVVSTTNAVNMTDYFKNNPESFSELSKILKLTGTASFLNAYGTYTIFAPTNDAIKNYLQAQGKAAVEDLSVDELKSLLKFHLLEDSIRTSKFTDGKLSDLTMYGQYLTTGAINVAGITKITVNRQANIVTPDIRVGNGIIHAIDHVLIPASQTVAQIVESNPKYSIFTEALKATGWYDALNILPANNTNEKQAWTTVIAESNQALLDSGIHSYAELKARFSNTGNPTLATDSLNLYVAYHVLSEAKYLADIIQSGAHTTLAPQQVLTAKLDGETVLINDDEYNGKHEPGFELIRAGSDLSATNGVVHDAATHFKIKLRLPYKVDFDVASVLGLPSSIYKKATYTYTKDESMGLANVKLSTATDKLIYRYGTGQSTSKTSYNMDVLIVPMGTSGKPEWVEFRTPMLITGRYKVWVGYYVQAESSSNGGTFCEIQTLMGHESSDERKPLSNARTLNFVTKRPGMAADVEEAIGWKTYMENTSGSQSSRMVGIIDIEQTGKYWIRFKAINGSQNTNNIDLIQFIPINMDQQYPKFKPDNTPIPRP